MLIRLIAMTPHEPGMKKVPKAYRPLLESSCKYQITDCLIATGSNEERARLALCEMIRNDQLMCHMDLAGLKPRAVNPRALVVALERLDEDIDTAGIFPDDFTDRWTFHGRFFLDGTAVPKDKQ